MANLMGYIRGLTVGIVHPLTARLFFQSIVWNSSNSSMHFLSRLRPYKGGRRDPLSNPFRTPRSASAKVACFLGYREREEHKPNALERSLHYELHYGFKLKLWIRAYVEYNSQVCSIFSDIFIASGWGWYLSQGYSKTLSNPNPMSLFSYDLGNTAKVSGEFHPHHGLKVLSASYRCQIPPADRRTNWCC